MRLKYNFLGKIHNNTILLSTFISMKMANFAPPPPLSLPLSHEEAVAKGFAQAFRRVRDPRTTAIVRLPNLLGQRISPRKV